MNLIGFGIMALSLILLNFFPNVLVYVLLVIGLLLFVSVTDEETFGDYVIVNSDKALVRKRYYFGLIPLMLISKILTLGKGTLMIPYKEEYFVVDTGSYVEGIPVIETDAAKQQVGLKQVSRSEYKALLKEQRQIYSNSILSKEFMESAYSIQSIGLKPKKKRLTIATVFAIITAVLVLVPDPMVWAMIAIYEAVFVPMVLLWIAPYKDAKILQAAYDRAMQNGN